MQNNHIAKIWRQAQPCCRRETAGWRVSSSPKKCFVSFEGFVEK